MLKKIKPITINFTESLFFYFLILLIVKGCNFNNTSKKIHQTSPNFILILTDDQGWNGTSVKMMYDEPNSKSDYFKTPNLEQLAKRGIRFSNA